MTKICPRCGKEMHIGAPHDDSYVAQFECSCGNIIPIKKGKE